MGHKLTLGQPELGRIWLPEVTISLPAGGKCRTRHEGLVVASQIRDAECIWASIVHNERVDRGASIQHNRCWGTIGQAANGVIVAVAVAFQTFTVTKTDLSIGSITTGVTTNEFTTIGLSRTTGTPQNLGGAPGALNGTQAGDIYKSFSVTGTGTAFGSGLFDSTTVVGSNLYAEQLFGSSAAVISGDTLNVTWTITF